MRELKIEPTFKTPFVNFKATGQLSIKGKSIPEDSLNFYRPLFDWVSGYGQYPARKTTLDVNLEFFNSSSSKCLIDVFKGLEKIKKQGFEVYVNWYYVEEDEDMLEAGKVFAEVLNLRFFFLKAPDKFKQ